MNVFNLSEPEFYRTMGKNPLVLREEVIAVNRPYDRRIRPV